MSQVQHLQRRQQIIQASLEIGSEQGEGGLTMRGIAARLGVSSTSIYIHFETKAWILSAIRIYGAESLQKEVLEPVAAIDDPAERLVAAGNNYVHFARSHKWLYSVLMGSEQAHREQRNSNPKETEMLLQPFQTYQGWLQEGAERGCWRAGLDLTLASFRVWMAVHGLCTMLLWGRTDQGARLFPFRDEQSFINAFNSAVVDSLKP